MTALMFDGDAVHELLEHSRAAAKNRVPYSESVTGKPGLLFVKDSGIYLMSNGEPGLMIDGLSPNGKHKMERHKVVYAKGFDDKADWGDIQAAAGGDDFVELIEDSEMLKDLQGCKLRIELTPKTMKIIVVPSDARRAKAKSTIGKK